jgi:excisionase family DNA binding protein
MAEDALTIRQAAALLNVHPNTVRNRVKAGKYRAEKVLTENGETYLIPRSVLEQETSTNSLVTPSLPQSPSQPLPDVREAMRAMLEPFVKELGEVREELGRERQRRQHSEEEAATLRAQLRALSEAREAPVSPGPTETPPDASAAPQTATRRPQAEDTGRPWWRRIFGG